MRAGERAAQAEQGDCLDIVRLGVCNARVCAAVDPPESDLGVALAAGWVAQGRRKAGRQIRGITGRGRVAEML